MINRIVDGVRWRFSRRGGQKGTWNRGWGRDRAYKNAPWRLDPGEVPVEVREIVDTKWFEPGSSVLDLGCGNGVLSAYLASNGYRVLGVDFASNAIRRATQTYGESESLRFRVVDTTKPGLDETFDCFFDRGCYHNLHGTEVEAYVRNIGRWSRPGARMWLHTNLPDDGRDRASEVQRDFAIAGFRVERQQDTLQRDGTPRLVFWMVRD